MTTSSRPSEEFQSQGHEVCVSEPTAPEVRRGYVIVTILGATGPRLVRIVSRVRLIDCPMSSHLNEKIAVGPSAASTTLKR